MRRSFAVTTAAVCLAAASPGQAAAKPPRLALARAGGRDALERLRRG